jgi:DmsE family decaheme c-type cytochrome
MSCHNNASGKRNHWTGSQHESRGIVCAACHEVHAKNDKILSKVTQPEVCFTCHKTQRAETHKISTHPIDAGKMSCSDCHNPHGSTGPKLLIKDTINATCYTCHAEKRGPLLFEHQPVIDDCTNCHTPHGSNNTPLLKARPPFLCQECHSSQHGNAKFSGSNITINGNVTTVNGQQGAGGANPIKEGAGRACLNCHVAIHGSNDPSGSKFNR